MVSHKQLLSTKLSFHFPRYERLAIEMDDKRMKDRADAEAKRWAKISGIANTVGKSVGASLEAKAAEDER